MSSTRAGLLRTLDRPRILLSDTLSAHISFPFEEFAHLVRQILHYGREPVQLTLLLMRGGLEALNMHSLRITMLSKRSLTAHAIQLRLVSSVRSVEIEGAILVEHFEGSNVSGCGAVAACLALRFSPNLIQLGSQLVRDGE